MLSFDGIPFAGRVTPSLSTISQPVEYQAKCIINGMLYLQVGIESSDLKFRKYTDPLSVSFADLPLFPPAPHPVSASSNIDVARPVAINFFAFIFFLQSF